MLCIFLVARSPLTTGATACDDNNNEEKEGGLYATVSMVRTITTTTLTMKWLEEILNGCNNGLS